MARWHCDESPDFVGFRCAREGTSQAPSGFVRLPGDAAGAAAKLGIPSSTLESKIRALGIGIGKHHFKVS